MRLKLNIIPNEIIQQYNILKLVSNKWVHIEVVKVMYGLKQAEKITYDKLVKKLKPYSYNSTKYTQ